MITRNIDHEDIDVVKYRLSIKSQSENENR